MANQPKHSKNSSKQNFTDDYRRPRKKKKSKLPYILAAVIAVLLIIVIVVMVCTSKQNSDKASNVSSTTSEIFSSHAASKEKASSVTVSTNQSEQESTSTQDENSNEETSTQEQSDEDEPISSDPSKNISRGLSWNLRLANSTNYISNSDRPTDLTEIDEVGREIDSRAYENYSRMVSDATAAGLNIFPISGFRSASTQTYLFNAELANVKANHPEYSDSEAYRVAASSVAAPGTSDHELGLAVDFNTDQEWFADSDEGIWLAAHCTEYGFVLRYPADKSDITKIVYEPWHFRYVGVSDAQKMKQLNMCLEEYVEYLVK